MEYLCAEGYTGYPTSETCIWDIPYYGCCKDGKDCSTEVKQISRDPDTHKNIVMGISWMVSLNFIWLAINLVGAIFAGRAGCTQAGKDPPKQPPPAVATPGEVVQAQPAIELQQVDVGASKA